MIIKTAIAQTHSSGMSQTCSNPLDFCVVLLFSSEKYWALIFPASYRKGHRPTGNSAALLHHSGSNETAVGGL